ncbi:uncharacterized protein [Ptychodera flava]|uniref:uncharacterized protein n=1 Tax=Ptychodera flava TaxID=63121 RepID=UPI00396A0E79
MTDIIKLSELEEKQPESKIQGVEDNKFEQQYSKRTERVNEKVSVQGFQQDSGNSGEMKTKPTEQELISGEISETAASTATRPDRPGKERRKVKRATSETTAYDRGHWSRKNVNVYQGQEKFKQYAVWPSTTINFWCVTRRVVLYRY